MKIYHIFNDKKFISDVNSFENELVANTIILIGDFKNDTKNNQFNRNFNSLKVITNFCKDADIVVLHQLDSFKTALANSLPKNVKVFWRFYGTEIYSRHQANFLSKRTKIVLSKNKTPFFSRVYNSFNYKISKFIEEKIYNYNFNFQKALTRIDLFLGLFEEEYLLIKKLEPNLPKFVRFYYSQKKVIFNSNLENRKPLLIIGNSRNHYNNHLDILNITKDNNKIIYILPFNYGSKSIYSSTVESMSKIQNIKLINSFLPINEYTKLINNSSAMVSNAYRQMAMGNIFLGLKNGLKIYLNIKNPTYHFLIKNNFLIFTMSDLKTDIKNENIILSKNEVKHNQINFNLYLSNYTQKTFFDSINNA